MIYRYHILTPLNTTEKNPKKTVLRIGRGIVHKIEIDFPPGSQGALHVAIRRGLNQVWPTNPSDYFSADDRLIIYPEHYEILFPPFRFTAITWNESLNNEHGVVIRLGILPRKYVMRKII